MDRKTSVNPSGMDTLAFTTEGLLPEGTYCMTLAQLRDSLLGKGEGRQKTIDALAAVAEQVWRVVGKDTAITVAGPFVEDTEDGAINGYFTLNPQDDRVESGELLADLKAQGAGWQSDADFQGESVEDGASDTLPIFESERVLLFGWIDRPGNDPFPPMQELAAPQHFRYAEESSSERGVIELVRE